jgi:hypothetical protein
METSRVDNVNMAVFDICILKVFKKNFKKLFFYFYFKLIYLLYFYIILIYFKIKNILKTTTTSVVLILCDETCQESLQPPEVTLIYHLPFGLILRFPLRRFEFSLRVEVC